MIDTCLDLFFIHPLRQCLIPYIKADDLLRCPGESLIERITDDIATIYCIVLGRALYYKSVIIVKLFFLYFHGGIIIARQRRRRRRLGVLGGQKVRQRGIIIQSSPSPPLLMCNLVPSGFDSPPWLNRRPPSVPSHFQGRDSKIESGFLFYIKLLGNVVGRMMIIKAYLCGMYTWRVPAAN